MFSRRRLALKVEMIPVTIKPSILSVRTRGLLAEWTRRSLSQGSLTPGYSAAARTKIYSCPHRLSPFAGGHGGLLDLCSSHWRCATMKARSNSKAQGSCPQREKPCGLQHPASSHGRNPDFPGAMHPRDFSLCHVPMDCTSNQPSTLTSKQAMTTRSSSA
jgi:hypothetical protein